MAIDLGQLIREASRSAIKRRIGDTRTLYISAYAITQDLLAMGREETEPVVRRLSSDGTGKKSAEFEKDGIRLRLVADPFYDGLNNPIGATYSLRVLN